MNTNNMTTITPHARDSHEGSSSKGVMTWVFCSPEEHTDRLHPTKPLGTTQREVKELSHGQLMCFCIMKVSPIFALPSRVESSIMTSENHQDCKKTDHIFLRLRQTSSCICFRKNENKKIEKI
ncbi:hypothetical protein E2C01_063481 [Portunus trituberculatus]|uniref:Uncharacterized protein n=1 Tax=Portunus trituberculatus TaxID=210409 RepID=A0A5B7HKZ4_PORTR|nr:hypothetical protein [Portunus trituberculatus]